ncbi:type II toxin-antitoxin system MqsA family antitoxin [Marinimicrobium sp. C2-29]|uniref:type II toxin-antitoxin system MqsA family antitoxin n=1 Tax=Marinimicrobium sp. C2-29 TaxID=3139825 RepID=UPI0031397609
MKQSVCPICEQGRLIAIEDMDDAEYGGVRRRLPLHYSECDVCGSETATPEQTRHNKRAMIAFKKEVDGLLTGQEIVALRKRLGLTQAQAAKLFGGGPVAFSKYEKDDVTQSESMDKLLRMADQIPAVMPSLAKQAGEDQLLLRINESRIRALETRRYVSNELKQAGDSNASCKHHAQQFKLIKSASAMEDTLDVG